MNCNQEQFRLLDGLMLQTAINGDIILAELIANECRISEYKAGDVLIKQGEHTDNLYFILRGCVEVIVNDIVVARRTAGQHVGEMAAIDPRADRSGTVRAVLDCEVAILTEQALSNISKTKPEIWRNIARELVQRLRELPAEPLARQNCEESYSFQMKRHLFYLFLVVFACTALLTLLGIAGVILINDFYLKGLYSVLLVELIGAVVGLFRATSFFMTRK